VAPGTGTLLWAGQVGKDKQANVSLTDLDLRIRPGDGAVFPVTQTERLTVTVELVSGSGFNAAALVWISDF
jgi:hypothetical protein